MWMQILKAAGFSVIGEAFPQDWGETIRDANPHGFYESILRHGIYYKTNPDPETRSYLLPEATRLHAVKVFIPGVVRSERAYLHRVIVNVRPWREYVRSVEQMRRLEQDARGLDELAPEPPLALEWWENNFKLIGDLAIRQYPCHVQCFDAVMQDPRGVIGRVLAWIGAGGDLDAAAAMVKPRPPRAQRPELEVDELVAPEVAQVFDEYYAAVEDGGGLSPALIKRMNETNAALAPEIEAHKQRLAKEVAAWRVRHEPRGPFAPLE